MELSEMSILLKADVMFHIKCVLPCSLIPDKFYQRGVRLIVFPLQAHRCLVQQANNH